MLEEAKSDVLILLDCCAAASSTASVGSGITEVIAACGFETWTPGVGEHSFSRSLIDELKFLSTGPPFTAAMLHNKVLARIKYWKPRYNAGASPDPRDLWREKRKTPVYILLASDVKQRSVELAPLRPSNSSRPASIVVPPPFPSDGSFTSLPGSFVTSDPDSMDLGSSQSSLSSVWPDPQFKCPKVLITVALEEDQWLHSGSFAEWLLSVPALVKFAQVEGVYHSDSTLVILSLPIAIWDLLPKNPALGVIGFVRSRNFVIESSPTRITSVPHIPLTRPDIPHVLVPKKEDRVPEYLTKREEILFITIFAEEIGEWMDTLNSAQHVSNILLPRKMFDLRIFPSSLKAFCPRLSKSLCFSTRCSLAVLAISVRLFRRTHRSPLQPRITMKWL
jgi:hypothetical protein